ncbi:MAG TPA: ankyrin repeat domain-containing protein [Vicinamibacterales bacterium]|nr:ankyrin repeat domain-containing protein [Vicinamibacterales bacterium]
MIERGARSTRRRAAIRGLLALAAAIACARFVTAQVPQEARLLDAVKRGDTAAARVLLGQGASANAADPDGTTALHWASRADNVDLVRLLLGRGGKASAANRYGVTPLSLAAVNGSAAITRLLLDAGANPNASSGEGETVLMTAARTGRPEPVALLLARGANLAASEKSYGETALMWAAGHGHPDVIRLLMKAGANPETRSTLLEFPKVKVDLATMVTTALPRGGMTALMYAARQGALASIDPLADGGAALDAVDPDGMTALVIAIVNAHFEVAARLVERGADPNIADNAGMAAVYAAVDMAHPDPLINRPPAKPTGRLTAAELVAVLLEHRANPNQTLKAPLLMRQHNTGDASLGDGATPLMRAAKAGDIDLVRILLDHGANPSLALKNQTTTMMVALSGRGARMVTADSPVFQTIKLCLEHGADVNATNASGETLLHQAVQRGDALVRLIAERGAKLDARDKQGRTPLDVAMGVAAPAPAGRGRGGRPGGAGAAPAQASESTVKLLRELTNAEATTREP